MMEELKMDEWMTNLAHELQGLYRPSVGTIVAAVRRHYRAATPAESTPPMDSAERKRWAWALDVVDAIEWLDQGKPNRARDVLAELRDNLRAATKADEERMRAAAERAGVGWWGCDTPEHMADEIEGLRTKLAATKAETLFTPKVLERLKKREAEMATKAETPWQSMDTAPRDGTRILVDFGKIGVHAVSWTEGTGITIWCVDDRKHGPFPLRGWIENDVHGWMPLPDPWHSPSPQKEPLPHHKWPTIRHKSELEAKRAEPTPAVTSEEERQ